MSNNVSADALSVSDDANDVKAAFHRLSAAFLKEGSLSKKDRKRYLRKLKKNLVLKKDDFCEAISKDFRGRASFETYSADVLPVISQIRYVLKNLDEWMAVKPQETSWVYWPARLELRPQALGVIGVISPWNYPLALCLLPLCDAIAAGNRVIIKPSEHVPHTAALIKDLVESVFPRDVATVCVGEVDVAVTLSRLPLNHLIFTGSVSVGKKVMAAAAENLTPVTLELGGKSPAIIHSSYDLNRAADRIVFGKCLNAGQTCIAPDYVLCPKEQVSAFIEAFGKQVNKRFSELKSNGDYTAIVNDRQRNRLLGLIEDAKEKGAKVHVFNPNDDHLEVKVAPTLLFDVNDEMAVMQEEIFGPLLPVVPYDSIQDAIDYVNARPRPLALYYFDRRRKRIEHLLNNTVSGGVCINETMIHFTQDDLPFGGVGSSGLGRYKGRNGFDSFSHIKPVLRQSRFTLIPKLTRQPYPNWVRWIIKTLIGN